MSEQTMAGQAAGQEPGGAAGCGANGPAMHGPPPGPGWPPQAGQAAHGQELPPGGMPPYPPPHGYGPHGPYGPGLQGYPLYQSYPPYPHYPPHPYWPWPPYPPAAAQAPQARAAGNDQGMAQAMQELANGGGVSGLAKLLDLDDKEFWKGALVGAALVLLLTHEGVQRALFRGAVRGQDAEQEGMDTAGMDKLQQAARAAGESADE